MQPIRTAAEITAKMIIPPLQQIPLYQKLSKKITELRLLGMSNKEIAKSLKNLRKNCHKGVRMRRNADLAPQLLDNSGYEEIVGQRKTRKDPSP